MKNMQEILFGGILGLMIWTGFSFLNHNIVAVYMELGGLIASIVCFVVLFFVKRLK